jgi:DNA-binding CsgD family transcriptional regulator
VKRIHANLLNPGPLSAKEAVVLRYICEGYTRNEIAGLVFRSSSTISSQIDSIAQKLDCHSAAEIVATAFALGLVSITIDQNPSLLRRIVVLILIVSMVVAQFDIKPDDVTTARLRLPTTRLIRNPNRA